MNPKFKIWSGAALALLLAASVAGTALAQKQGGTMTAIETVNPRHFNSAVQSGVVTMVPGAQLFAAPLRVDENWNVHPYLAESWTVSDDGLTVTLNLVKGAKFHDGVAITSADVKFSLEANRDNHPFKPMFGPLTNVETPDPHTAILRLKQPHPALALALTAPLAPIIPKHIYGDGQDIKKHPRNTKDVVGSGPFVLKTFKRKEHAILERNPNYFRKGRPYLDRIVYKNFGQVASQIIAMEQGQADLYSWVSSPRALVRLKKSKHLVLDSDTYVAIGPNNWLAFNLLRKPLSDVRVRKAIAFAIDRDFITKALHAGFSYASTGPIVPGTPFYNGDVERYDLDLKRANKILDDAGYKKGADGMRFKLTVDYLPSPRIDEHHKALAEYMKPQLKKIGIDVSVRTSPDFPTWANYVRNYDFDISMDLPFNWRSGDRREPLLSVDQHQERRDLVQYPELCQSESGQLAGNGRQGARPEQAQVAVSRVPEDRRRRVAGLLDQRGAVSQRLQQDDVERAAENRLGRGASLRRRLQAQLSLSMSAFGAGSCPVPQRSPIVM